jgi:hypothetical protein
MVLKNHVRRGKKLLPPMIAAGHPIELGNWPIDRLPELFWLAAMVERFGKREACDLVADMTKAIQDSVAGVAGTSQVIRSYLMSEHSQLSSLERETIVKTHRRSSWLKVIQPLIADYCVVWPDLPAGYLAMRKSRRSGKTLAKELKELLRRFSHRHDPLALIVQAIVVSTEIRSGHCGIASGLRIPDLNAVFEYPNTDESQHAAGFVVAMCGQMVRFGRKDSDFSWHRRFWNNCYRLQPCEHE